MVSRALRAILKSYLRGVASQIQITRAKPARDFSFWIPAFAGTTKSDQTFIGLFRAQRRTCAVCRRLTSSFLS
jgi:hypothetical protein